ncbi:hypothetical protein GCK72_023340 [Caenorhabditis remanei]|uniref:Uncharacterized protein n=1 Tax=Caenorhabditis remanei TaxID=31234 RepID=A0A2P4WPZ1_CAERE|nr:hypothetical protein GCK72_023340 [Caenorhabditis remanei]KAF1746882.1 hypothetical protein GCK72_023340 [Caenorhabditis remanei]
MSDKMVTIEEFLSKLGYSKHALESEIVTEDLLDEMCFQRQTAYCADPNDLFEDENGNGLCRMMQADGKPFDSKPTLVKTCN